MSVSSPKHSHQHSGIHQSHGGGEARCWGLFLLRRTQLGAKASNAKRPRDNTLVGRFASQAAEPERKKVMKSGFLYSKRAQRKMRVRYGVNTHPPRTERVACNAMDVPKARYGAPY